MSLTILDPLGVKGRLEKQESLPTLPTIATELIHLASDPFSSLHSLAEIIACDPIVTATVLRIANSSFMGLKTPVNDLPNSVLYLGMSQIRRIALAATTSDLFSPDGFANEFL